MAIVTCLSQWVYFNLLADQGKLQAPVCLLPGLAYIKTMTCSSILLTMLLVKSFVIKKCFEESDNFEGCVISIPAID